MSTLQIITVVFQCVTLVFLIMTVFYLARASRLQKAARESLRKIKP